MVTWNHGLGCACIYLRVPTRTAKEEVEPDQIASAFSVEQLLYALQDSCCPVFEEGTNGFAMLQHSFSGLLKAQLLGNLEEALSLRSAVAVVRQLVHAPPLAHAQTTR